MADFKFIFVTAIVSFTLSLSVHASTKPTTPTGSPAKTPADVRAQLKHFTQTDFFSHAQASGLLSIMHPLSATERKFRDLIQSRFGQNLTDAEVHLLMRAPQLDLAVKRIHDDGYALSEKFCASSDSEDNEVDSTRHFTSSFMLSMLVGNDLAYEYLTAHESGFEQCYTGHPCDLSHLPNGPMASTIMDLHNNLQGLIAAKAYRLQQTYFEQWIQIDWSFEEIQKAAYKALADARQKNLLFALRSTVSSCTQASQNQSFRTYTNIDINAPL